MATNLTAPTLPLHVTLSLTTAAEVITVGPSVSAIYFMVDDVTDPSIGRCATDASNYQPVAAQTWELIYTKPAGGGTRDAVIQVKVSAGTATGYLRVF